MISGFSNILVFPGDNGLIPFFSLFVFVSALIFIYSIFPKSSLYIYFFEVLGVMIFTAGMLNNTVKYYLFQEWESFSSSLEVVIILFFLLIILGFNSFRSDKSIKKNLLSAVLALNALLLFNVDNVFQFVFISECLTFVFLTYSFCTLENHKGAKLVKALFASCANLFLALISIVFFVLATKDIELKGIIVSSPKLLFVFIVTMFINMIIKLSSLPIGGFLKNFFVNTSEHMKIVSTSLFVLPIVVTYINLIQKLLLELDPIYQIYFLNLMMVISIISILFSLINTFTQKTYESYSYQLFNATIVFQFFMLFFMPNEKTETSVLLISSASFLPWVGFFVLTDYYRKKVGLAQFEFFSFYKRDVKMSFLYMICIISLVGVPLTSGFTSKLSYFVNLILESNILLPIILVLLSALMMYQYCKILIDNFRINPDYSSFESIDTNNYLNLKIISIVVILINLAGGIMPFLI